MKWRKFYFFFSLLLLLLFFLYLSLSSLFHFLTFSLLLLSLLSPPLSHLLSNPPPTSVSWSHSLTSSNNSSTSFLSSSPFFPSSWAFSSLRASSPSSLSSPQPHTRERARCRVVYRHVLLTITDALFPVCAVVVLVTMYGFTHTREQCRQADGYALRVVWKKGREEEERRKKKKRKHKKKNKTSESVYVELPEEGENVTSTNSLIQHNPTLTTITPSSSSSSSSPSYSSSNHNSTSHPNSCPFLFFFPLASHTHTRPVGRGTSTVEIREECWGRPGCRGRSGGRVEYLLKTTPPATSVAYALHLSSTVWTEDAFGFSPPTPFSYVFRCFFSIYVVCLVSSFVFTGYGNNNLRQCWYYSSR